MSNGLVKIKNRDNFSNVIAVRDAQMIKEDITRHHPTACNYTINRFAIFKGVK